MQHRTQYLSFKYGRKLTNKILSGAYGRLTDQELIKAVEQSDRRDSLLLKELFQRNSTIVTYQQAAYLDDWLTTPNLPTLPHKNILRIALTKPNLSLREKFHALILMNKVTSNDYYPIQEQVKWVLGQDEEAMAPSHALQLKLPLPPASLDNFQNTQQWFIKLKFLSYQLSQKQLVKYTQRVMEAIEKMAKQNSAVRNAAIDTFCELSRYIPFNLFSHYLSRMLSLLQSNNIFSSRSIIYAINHRLKQLTLKQRQAFRETLFKIVFSKKHVANGYAMKCLANQLDELSEKQVHTLRKIIHDRLSNIDTISDDVLEVLSSHSSLFTNEEIPALLKKLFEFIKKATNIDLQEKAVIEAEHLIKKLDEKQTLELTPLVFKLINYSNPNLFYVEEANAFGLELLQLLIEKYRESTISLIFPKLIGMLKDSSPEKSRKIFTIISVISGKLSEKNLEIAVTSFIKFLGSSTCTAKDIKLLANMAQHCNINQQEDMLSVIVRFIRINNKYTRTAAIDSLNQFQRKITNDLTGLYEHLFSNNPERVHMGIFLLPITIRHFSEEQREKALNMALASLSGKTFDNEVKMRAIETLAKYSSRLNEGSIHIILSAIDSMNESFCIERSLGAIRPCIPYFTAKNIRFFVSMLMKRSKFNNYDVRDHFINLLARVCDNPSFGDEHVDLLIKGMLPLTDNDRNDSLESVFTWPSNTLSKQDKNGYSLELLEKIVHKLKVPHVKKLLLSLVSYISNNNSYVETAMMVIKNIITKLENKEIEPIIKQLIENLNSDYDNVAHAAKEVIAQVIVEDKINTNELEALCEDTCGHQMSHISTELAIFIDLHRKNMEPKAKSSSHHSNQQDKIIPNKSSVTSSSHRPK